MVQLALSITVAKLFMAMTEQYPDRCTIVRYEDLIADTHGEVQRLFAFLGWEVTEQTTDFIEQSTSKVVESIWSVFKGKKRSDEWRDAIPEHIQQVVEETLTNTEFERFIR